MIDSGFDEFVGMSALEGSLISEKYCNCSENFFGPICDKDIEKFEEDADCGENSIFDPQNTITGCSCREPVDGNATEYHGWYCEKHNR